MTTYSDISPVTRFPLLIDPHVPGARSHRTRNGMPCGSNGNINLSGSRHSTGANHQNNQKCQFYNFTFHMLVFKYDYWIVIGQQG